MVRLPFSEELCRKAKEGLRSFSQCMVIYKNYFSYSNSIGNCTNLYRLHQPVSYEDFYNKYIDYAEKNQNLKVYDRGLSYYELRMMAEFYKIRAEYNGVPVRPVENYFYDLLCHIIIETFDGQQQERQITKYLENMGFKCSTFEGNLDAKYGIDRKLEKDDKTYALQIKPVSFFFSKRKDVIEDRIKLCKEYELAKDELGIKTFYSVYKRDELDNSVQWYKNGNSFCFKIKDLFDYDKNNIEHTLVDKRPFDILEKLSV